MPGPHPPGSPGSTPSARGLRRRVASRCTLLAVGAGLLVALASPAEAGLRWLRWKHPAPREVEAFEVYVGSSSRQYGSRLVIGKPKPDDSGVFSALVDLGEDGRVFVAIRAIGKNGLSSDLSNERQVVQTSDEPVGQPPAPTIILP